jgi:hypothetical protein
MESLGTIALVPFGGYIGAEALTVAETATEAQRAVLFRLGFSQVSPGCVQQSLRRQRAQVWGELSAEARQYLTDVCGAERLLTGSVEHWDLTGSGREPEPQVALALRLLDARTGRIQWMDAREAAGWDGVRLLGVGRVHSRGALLDRILSALTADFVRYLQPDSKKETQG